MKKSFIFLCIIIALIGLTILSLAEASVDKTNHYVLYVILINLGVALITISTVSLVSKYITYSELVKEYNFIHDREQSGLNRIYKNWEDCISNIHFNDKLVNAKTIILVGYSHAKTIFAHDDEALLNIFKSVKSIDIYIADVEKYYEQVKKSYMSKRFPVDSALESKKRIEEITAKLSVSQKKKIKVYTFDPERINILSIKIIDEITILRLVGINQAGFNSPFFQFNQSGETHKFINSYIDNLKNISTQVTL